MGLRSRINTKQLLFAAGLAIILFTVLLDATVLSNLKSSYQDTKNIISKLAGSTEEEANPLKWLKELPEDDWLSQGEEFLSFYGYDSKTKTVWDKKYLVSRNKILAVSAAFDTFLLLLLFLLFHFLQRQNKQRVDEVEKALRQLQTIDSDALNFVSAALEPVLRDRLFSLQEQIQTDHTQLQEEKESTKAFVTDISHQLKTPIAALKTNLEILSGEEMTKKQQKEFLNSCISQLEGLENLTKTLVNVSRMEKGMIQLHLQPADIGETILAAVSRIYEKAAEKDISIEMPQGSFPEHVLVPHDKKWTIEVLVNIMDNAVKYSEPHTQITIHTETLTTYLKIDIEDEGIGIPKSEYHKIFQRFYRGDLVKETEGSGIGLYLAREIMEKQNGIIFVRSRHGRKGSIFSIQLPKA